MENVGIAPEERFSNFRASNSPGGLVKTQIAGHPSHRFWFSRSGISLRIFISEKFPGDDAFVDPGPHL